MDSENVGHIRVHESQLQSGLKSIVKYLQSYFDICLV